MTKSKDILQVGDLVKTNLGYETIEGLKLPNTTIVIITHIQYTTFNECMVLTTLENDILADDSWTPAVWYDKID